MFDERANREYLRRRDCDLLERPVRVGFDREPRVQFANPFTPMGARGRRYSTYCPCRPTSRPRRGGARRRQMGPTEDAVSRLTRRRRGRWCSGGGATASSCATEAGDVDEGAQVAPVVEACLDDVLRGAGLKRDDGRLAAPTRFTSGLLPTLAGPVGRCGCHSAAVRCTGRPPRGGRCRLGSRQPGSPRCRAGRWAKVDEGLDLAARQEQHAPGRHLGKAERTARTVAWPPWTCSSSTSSAVTVFGAGKYSSAGALTRRRGGTLRGVSVM